MSLENTVNILNIFNVSVILNTIAQQYWDVLYFGKDPGYTDRMELTIISLNLIYYFLASGENI